MFCLGFRGLDYLYKGILIDNFVVILILDIVEVFKKIKKIWIWKFMWEKFYFYIEYLLFDI